MEPQSWDSEGRGNSEACLMVLLGFLQASPAFPIVFVPYVVHCLHGLPPVCTHLRRSTGAAGGGGRRRGETRWKQVNANCRLRATRTKSLFPEIKTWNKWTYSSSWVQRVVLQRWDFFQASLEHKVLKHSKFVGSFRQDLCLLVQLIQVSARSGLGGTLEQKWRITAEKADPL